MKRLAWTLVALAGCDVPPVDDPSMLLLREVRQLNATLQDVARSGMPPQGPSQSAALGEALAPLREAMQAMVAAQGDLGRRQLALTQELGRWSALLAEMATTNSRSEATSLRERLAAIEQQMQQQDQRHREVEQLVQQALERSAQRLDDFLRAVENLRRDAAPGAGSGASTEVTPAGNTPGNSGPGASSVDPGRKDADAAPLSAQQRGRNWLLAVLAGGLFAIGLLAWRLSRPAVAHPVAADLREDRGPPPASERSADELWLAANLLGEAVGRLRHARNEAAPAPAPLPAVDGDDDLFVLEDEPGEPAASAAAPAEPLPVPSGAVTAGTSSTGSEAAPAVLPRPQHPIGPQRLALLLPSGDRSRARAAVTAFLARDPRVLRRPVPLVEETADGLRVECALLPDQPAGEQEHLRALLARLAQG